MLASVLMRLGRAILVPEQGARDRRAPQFPIHERPVGHRALPVRQRWRGRKQKQLEVVIGQSIGNRPGQTRCPCPPEIRPDRSLSKTKRGGDRPLVHPLGFGYAWFCEHYEAWKGRVRPTMRQTHVGGEKVFVDFAGDTVDVIDPATGEARAVKLFVAAMGASNYTYADGHRQGFGH